jgi:hypothetical protein
MLHQTITQQKDENETTQNNKFINKSIYDTLPAGIDFKIQGCCVSRRIKAATEINEEIGIYIVASANIGE